MSRPKLLNIFDESPDKILYTKTPSYVTVVQTDDSLVIQDTITEIQNASIISFISPCNSNIVTSITINGLAYAIKDATGKPISECGSVFAEGTTVTVTLDIINKTATLASTAYGLTKESKNYIDQSDEILRKEYSPALSFVEERKIKFNFIDDLHPSVPYAISRTRICYGGGKFVAIGKCNFEDAETIFFGAYSIDGFNWNKSDINNKYDSICHGNDKFVAVGTNKVAYSTDGITWTTNSLTGNWFSVCYGGDKFVAVGSDKVAYSTDGINWTTSTLTGTWNSVCYGNGKFVAVGSDNKVAYSTDGINWTSNYLTGSWTSVCYGNGKFVAVGGLSNVAYSTDGINWTTATLSGTWKSVCYGNDKFVAVGYSSKVAYSTDGINWTIVNTHSTSGLSGNWNSVCYGVDKFVAIDSSIIYSTDGIDWSNKFPIISTTNPPLNDTDVVNKNYVDGKVDKFIERKTLMAASYDDLLYSICYGNDKFVAVGYKTVAYSTDGISWNPPISLINRWKSVCYGNDKFVTVGSNKVAYSTDGITWTTKDLINWWSSVCYSSDVGKFVVVGEDRAAYSTDGVNWPETNALYGDWYSVCYSSDVGKFVAAGENKVAYSTDGITWTTNSLTGPWRSVCYSSDVGKFVTVGPNRVAYSSDGISWNSPISVIGSWSSVCYGNGKFVAVGGSNNVGYSTDAITWTTNYLTGSWQSVCYNNGIFISVGSEGRIIYSRDGINWSDKDPNEDILTSSSITVIDDPKAKTDAVNKYYVDNEINNLESNLIAVSIKTTLYASNWTGTAVPYTYNLSVTEVTDTSNQDILPSTYITAEQIEALSAAVIVDGGQSTGKIILKAFGEKPTINIPIRVIIRKA